MGHRNGTDDRVLFNDAPGSFNVFVCFCYLVGIIVIYPAVNGGSDLERFGYSYSLGFDDFLI